MSPIPRAEALRLAGVANDLGAEALRGKLALGETGRLMVGHIEVESWLSRHSDQEVVLAVAAIDEQTQLAYTRTCRTCGNEFSGRSCPHCEEVRNRLRR